MLGSVCIKRDLHSQMINQITPLKCCWHISPEWGQSMPPLAVKMLKKVLLSISDLSGYCCGVHTKLQSDIVFLPLPQEPAKTNIFECNSVSLIIYSFKINKLVYINTSAYCYIYLVDTPLCLQQSCLLQFLTGSKKAVLGFLT
jgi:hypothetical protein